MVGYGLLMVITISLEGGYGDPFFSYVINGLIIAIGFHSLRLIMIGLAELLENK